MTSEARDPDPEASPAEKPQDLDDTTGSPAQQAPAKDPLRHSRTSGGWIAVVVLLVVIISLAIFVLQNTQQVNIAFLGWDGRAPLAAALLIATAAGLLLAVAAGSLRILQLRRRVKRVRRSTEQGSA
jgi:uncharacterized integral membrane protein